MHLVLLFVAAVLFGEIACTAVTPSARSNETDHSGREGLQLSNPFPKSGIVFWLHFKYITKLSLTTFSKEVTQLQTVNFQLKS